MDKTLSNKIQEALSETKENPDVILMTFVAAIDTFISILVDEDGNPLSKEKKREMRETMASVLLKEVD